MTFKLLHGTPFEGNYWIVRTPGPFFWKPFDVRVKFDGELHVVVLSTRFAFGAVEFLYIEDKSIKPTTLYTSTSALVVCIVTLWTLAGERTNGVITRGNFVWATTRFFTFINI